MSTGDFREPLADALWHRVRSIALAAHRLDRLPENAGETARLEGADAAKLATEMVLRLLRVGSDPVNFKLLSHLVQQGSVGMRELAGEVDLPPLAVSERVADLVQVGLAARSLVGDQVQGTEAARAFVELVGDMARALEARVVEEWGGIMQEGGR